MEVNDLATARQRIYTLEQTMEETRTALQKIQEQVERLTRPPRNYGTFMRFNSDGSVDVNIEGRVLAVTLDERIPAETLRMGQRVGLNEFNNVVWVPDEEELFERKGDVCTLLGLDLRDTKRLIVQDRADEKRVVYYSAALTSDELKIGDDLLVDFKSGFALEKMPKAKDMSRLLLEEPPDVDYGRIGGLDSIIKAIREELEMPFLYPDEYLAHQLRLPKGILLHGPPGCGKTLIAKAIANDLARNMGRTACFLNVKGPQLLNKYVGESEGNVRQVFLIAREEARDGKISVFFFDEIEALFYERGSGVSSDIELTVVAQFLAELDGLQEISNVLVIGASNRPDLLDPAAIRDGRLELKFKIPRPDRGAASDILSKYITSDLPLHASEVAHDEENRSRVVQRFIAYVVETLYAPLPYNHVVEVSYASGQKHILSIKDVAVSGSMFEHIVRRAKHNALLRMINRGPEERGLCLADFAKAIQDEYVQNEELYLVAHRESWERVYGRPGDHVIAVRTLLPQFERTSRPADIVPTGQYL